MKYEKFDRDDLDDCVSHYIYTSLETDERELLEFLEKNGVDIGEIEYVEYETVPGRHIFHGFA